jgi:hypothetical protein
MQGLRRVLLCVIPVAVPVLACGGSGRAGAQSVDGGAGEPSPTPSVRPVCDGSSAIRLAIAYDGETGGHEIFSAVNFELGDPYVFVDGTCRYWVRTWSEDPVAYWRPIHTGLLSETDAKVLGDSMHYDDLPSLVQTCEPTQGYDMPSVQLYDGKVVTGCWANAPVLKPAEATWFDLCANIYSAGQPVQGALRVTVGVGYDSVFKSYKWPLTIPIENFLVADQDATTPGKSKRLSDPPEVAKLLALREQYLQDIASHVGAFGIKIEGGYVLYFREDLPFTGEDGLPIFGHAP